MHTHTHKPVCVKKREPETLLTMLTFTTKNNSRPSGDDVSRIYTRTARVLRTLNVFKRLTQGLALLIFCSVSEI